MSALHTFCKKHINGVTKMMGKFFMLGSSVGQSWGFLSWLRATRMCYGQIKMKFPNIRNTGIKVSLWLHDYVSYSKPLIEFKFSQAKIYHLIAPFSCLQNNPRERSSISAYWSLLLCVLLETKQRHIWSIMCYRNPLSIPISQFIKSKWNWHSEII